VKFTQPVLLQSFIDELDLIEGEFKLSQVEIMNPVCELSCFMMNANGAHMLAMY
jgi:hypothetical protein